MTLFKQTDPFVNKKELIFLKILFMNWHFLDIPQSATFAINECF